MNIQTAEWRENSFHSQIIYRRKGVFERKNLVTDLSEYITIN